MAYIDPQLMYICLRCGKVPTGNLESKFPICDYCKSDKLGKTSRKEIDEVREKCSKLYPNEGFRIPSRDGEMLREKYVYHNNPYFDKVAYNERLEQKQRDYIRAKQEIREQDAASSGHPKCPTCGSLNTKKISGMSKAVSVSLFGLFSQKVKRQFHCNNCGYEW